MSALGALGAYLTFLLLGWVLIRGGRLIEAGRLLNFHNIQQQILSKFVFIQQIKTEITLL